MNHPFALALVLLTLAPQNQNLPAEFHKLPDEVKTKATIVLTGTYVRGRGPCIFMPDGSRRWALLSWLNIKKVYRGQVGSKSIQINPMSPKNEDGGVKLEVDQEYLVLLRPSEESMKAIKAGKYIPSWDALSDEELVAFVKLK